MNFENLLHHDVINCLMNYLTLESIMTINMISKKILDLTKHNKIKNAFCNSYSYDPTFFTKFAQNDNLIAHIYEHKIIMWENFIRKDQTYKVLIHYADCDYDVEKIFLAIVNNDVTYIYFCLFVNNSLRYTTLQIIANVFRKYDLYEKYKKFIKHVSASEHFNFFKKINFTINAPKSKHPDKNLSMFPYLLISLILGNHNMIKNIFDLHNECSYYYSTRNLGGAQMWDFALQFDTHVFLYNCVVELYPQLQKSFDKFMIKDKIMYDIMIAKHVRCSFLIDVDDLGNII